MPKPFQAFDPFQTLTDEHQRVRLLCRRGQVELSAIAPGVLRVRAGLRRALPAPASLALTDPQPPAPEYQLRPAAGGARFSQPGLDVQIQFEPLTLSLSRSSAAHDALTVFELGRQDTSMVARATIAPDAHVYGLGEKTGWLDKRHRRYQMRNSDVLWDHPEGIGIATDPLYASFPFFIVHGAAGSYGVFVDNPEFTTFDFTRADGYDFAAPAPMLTFYLMAGPSLPAVLQQYTALTGRLPLPALWTLGYHQCRWGYKSDAEFRAIAHELRSRGFPADVVWFDIDYMDGYRVFTWDKKRFPHPARLLADLKAQGLRGVTIVDPGVKVDPNYELYREGHAAGHFVRHTDGREYNGNVWPGLSALPDFHDPAARAWWAGHVRRWIDETGLAGIWNDMNEPAVTDVSGPVLETLHANGTLPHTSARNTYGLQMARATYAGLLEQNPDSRPFILTRAAYCGAQTVTAQWGGDNTALWEHLSGSLPMLMNMGLSGMPFVGVDIGGFVGDTHAELLARWFQAGAFYPFCRNHAISGSQPHEPWAFGPEIEAICRRYIELRYRLLPYTYNLFRDAALTGAPIMRPLAWHYPQDAATFNLSDQFLFGPDLLVAPVVAPGVSARAVYLPKGDWYRWGAAASAVSSAAAAPEHGPSNVLADAPLSELPLYVRGGAILPLWPVAAHTGAIPREQLELHLWPGRGSLDYYEDDGLTQAFTRGEFRLTPFRWRTTKSGSTLDIGLSSGAYRDARRKWNLVFHNQAAVSAQLDGQPIRLRRAKGTLTVRIPDDGAKHTLQLMHKP